MTTINIPTFHPDSATDGRLFIQTPAFILGYCPRSKAALEQCNYEQKMHLREPMGIVEFLVDVCAPVAKVSRSGQAALYLAAQSITAKMAGDEARAQELEAMRERLLTAEKAANDIIEQSGVEQAIEQFRNDRDNPF